MTAISLPFPNLPLSTVIKGPRYKVQFARINNDENTVLCKGVAEAAWRKFLRLVSKIKCLVEARVDRRDYSKNTTWHRCHAIDLPALDIDCNIEQLGSTGALSYPDKFDVTLLGTVPTIWLEYHYPHLSVYPERKTRVDLDPVPLLDEFKLAVKAAGGDEHGLGEVEECFSGNWVL